MKFDMRTSLRLFLNPFSKCCERALFVIILILPIALFAEDEFEKEFEQFTAEAEQEFWAFSQAAEEEYAESLARDWAWFEQASELDAWSGPAKPQSQAIKKMPELSPLQLDTEHLENGASKNRRNQANTTSLAQDGALARKQPNTKANSFFGYTLSRVALSSKLPNLQGHTKQDIINFRNSLYAHPDSKEISKRLKSHYKTLFADSWVALRLVEDTCEYLYLQHNARQTCTWFFAQTVGLDTRIAKDKNGALFALIHSQQDWHKHSFFEVNGERLYVMDDSAFKSMGGRMKLIIHFGKHRSQFSVVSSDLSKGIQPSLNRMTSQEIKWQDKALKLDFDLDHIYYLSQLPNLSIQDYLKDSLPDYLHKQLIDELNPHLNTSSAITYAQSLLAFLQRLRYQTDEVQFGHENPLTAAEALFYPFSDCEDRVYTLAALLNEKLELAALKYPGHLSAALKIDGKWVEADPTYQGAGLGETQPQYRKVEAKWYFH